LCVHGPPSGRGLEAAQGIAWWFSATTCGDGAVDLDLDSRGSARGLPVRLLAAWSPIGCQLVRMRAGSIPACTR
jgi:hypothetical protein